VRIAILGVGLIGGSLAAALRARAVDASIAGFAPGGDAARACEIGLVDEAFTDPVAAVQGADWVVLAAPVPAMGSLMQTIAPALGPSTRITDCGSTKRSVVEAARAALGPAFARYVAGHPIAGSERSGPDAANPDLFRGKRWVLCPVDALQREHCGALRELLEPTGAVISEMSPDAHDRLFAEVSHWPHAVAFALGAAIGRGELADRAIEFSGGGLRDTSRVAASSPELWAGILLDNADAVLESAERYQAELARIVAAIERRDRASLIESLETASRWRRRLG
jgi:prephenate dehydrogenase